MGRKGNDEGLTFRLRFQIHSFEREEEGMAAGPVLGTKVFTHLQEREGKGKKKRKKERKKERKKSDTNAPYEKNRLDQQLVGGGSEGKPFHQVLEIQAAGS